VLSVQVVENRAVKPAESDALAHKAAEVMILYGMANSANIALYMIGR
jgi:hypothetical protein